MYSNVFYSKISLFMTSTFLERKLTINDFFKLKDKEKYGKS